VQSNIRHHKEEDVPIYPGLIWLIVVGVVALAGIGYAAYRSGYNDGYKAGKQPKND